MEPGSIILTALVAGTTKAVSDMVPDAYKALKDLIKRKFAGDPKAEMVLEEHESDPDTYAAPLKKKLIEAGADKDEEIIKKAQELLKLANPEEAAKGTYNTIGTITVSDSKGIVGQVSGGSVNQTFS